MVSAILHDALSDPYSVVLSLHNGHSDMQLPQRVAQHFRNIFREDDAFAQIPPATASQTSRSRLVRFRAMVQDTSFSPEVYPSFLQNGKPGGWGLAETEMADDFQHFGEREVIWAVSIPGESSFVAELLDDPDTPSPHVEAATGALRHKDPLCRENHIGAQVKLYDSTSLPLKPTELYTFVGLLTLEHLSSGDDLGQLVPTFHTLFLVKHDPVLLSLKYFSPDHTIRSDDQADPSAATTKDQLIQWVADAALGGDRDAALWTLLVTVARVKSRQPPLFPPSLTLSRFPRPENDDALDVQPTPALAHVLRRLLPLFVDVPLTLPLINTRLFEPESRDETLHAGLLQLSAGTTVMLSDSGVQEGKITETGIKNIQALRNVLTMQTVNYHFPFAAPYQFPTDLSFIFLTEGMQSAFVETLVNVPLECTNPRDCYRRPEDIQEPSADRIDAFRHLLGSAKTGDVEITDTVSKYIQENFVHERQMDKTISPEDLMIWMTVARLLALLSHNTELTAEVWQQAKELDQRRKKRFLASSGIV